MGSGRQRSGPWMDPIGISRPTWYVAPQCQNEDQHGGIGGDVLWGGEGEGWWGWSYCWVLGLHLYRHTHVYILIFNNTSFVRFCLLDFTHPNLIHYINVWIKSVNTKCVVKCSKCLHMFFICFCWSRICRSFSFQWNKSIKL